MHFYLIKKTKFISVATILILMMSLAGCAGSPAALSRATPQQLANESNYNLCRAAFSNRATRDIEDEVRRRQIDCDPYVAAAARNEANRDAAFDRLNKSLAPPANESESAPCMYSKEHDAYRNCHHVTALGRCAHFGITPCRP